MIHPNRNLAGAGIVALLMTAAGTARADNRPYLIRDVEGVPTPSSSPRTFLRFEDQFLFSANSPEQGNGLWLSDGTAAGTRLLRRDLSVRATGTREPVGGRIGNRTYFSGLDGSGRVALWATDGTSEGTDQVSAVWAAGSSSPTRFVEFGGRLFFNGPIANSVTPMWVTDGTEAGTRVFFPNFATPLAVVGERLLFVGYDDEAGDELWTTDGTIDGTFRLIDLYPGRFPGFFAGFAKVGDVYCFAARDPDHGIELWSSDGTPEGTRIVRELVPGTGGPFHPSNTAYAALMGSTLLFLATTPEFGAEVWRTDGTEAGTGIFIDFQPGPNSGAALGPITATLDRVFFRTGSTGVASSDGTVEGSHVLPLPSGVRSVVAGHDVALIRTTSITTNLWRSDGSVAGTYPLPATAASEITWTGDRFVFQASDAAHGAELWESDGSLDGTRMIVDIANVAGGYPQNFADIHGTLVFSSDDPIAGVEPFRTRGTPETTALIADVAPGAGPSNPWDFRPLGDRVIFCARPDTVDGPIWMTNEDLTGASAGNSPPALRLYQFELNGYLFMRDTAGATWRTDGFTSNSIVNATFSPLSILGSQLLMAGSTSAVGNALWLSDGTTAGTTPIDIPSGPADYGSSVPIGLFRDRFYYSLSSAPAERTWSTDGTVAGTRPVPGTTSIRVTDVPTPVVMQDSLYLQARIGTVESLVAIDGPDAAPRVIATPMSAAKLVALDDRVYALVASPLESRGLWVSAGVEGDPVRLLEFNPGAFTTIVVFDGAVFFTGMDEAHGRELWRTRGTPETTEMVYDLNPGPAGSDPNWLTVSGDRLYFSANDGVRGVELWAINRTVHGDLDGDGDTDIQDLAVLLSNFGGEGPEGDLDGDGDVDLSDLNSLLSNFGDRIEP